MAEEQEDNTSQENTGDNTPEDNPKIPRDPNEEPREEKQEEPQDPEFEEFQQRTPDMQTAYKRYKDSSEEAKRLKEEKERLEKEFQETKQYSESLVGELQNIFQRNPKLAEEIQKELSGNTEKTQEQQQESTDSAALSEEDRKVIQQVRSQQQAEMAQTVHEFREQNADFIKSDEDWEHVREIAASLDGKKDREGKPYTLRTALRDALIIHNPEVIADEAKMQTLASMERRESASQDAGVPSGDSSTGGESAELSDQEKEVARKSGISEEAYAKAKQRIQKRNQ